MRKSNIYLIVYVFSGLLCMNLARRFVSDDAEIYVLGAIIIISTIAFMCAQLRKKGKN